MKLDILGVQAFVAVAEQGNFQKAAQSLFISQAALSRRLQNLESYLGLRLIERTSRSRGLSPVGEDFLPQARRLLDELRSSITALRDRGRSVQGDVTMACVPTIGIRFLPEIIQGYLSRHPQNRVRILDHASSGVEQAVLRREAEFGIGIAGLGRGDLRQVELMRDRFVLLCRRDHPLARRRSLPWSALQAHALILPGVGSSNRPLLDVALGERRLALQSTFEVQRSSTAVGLVAAGVGAAVVPGLAIQPGSHPSLVAIPLVEPVLDRTFVLLTRHGSVLSPAAQALHDMCAAGVVTRRWASGLKSST